MSFLHFVFSDAKKYWQKGGFLNLSFLHYLIGNGLANIYIHNWIRWLVGFLLKGLNNSSKDFHLLAITIDSIV